MPSFTLLINPISQPIQIGVYLDNTLHEQYELEGMVSDVLLQKVESLLSKYKIEKIIYVNGPGTHMATKLCYIMIDSIRIMKGIEFFACSGFDLNENQPIKAIGNLYFIKGKETIITQKFDDKLKQKYQIPERLDDLVFESSNKPNYILPAVQR